MPWIGIDRSQSNLEIEDRIVRRVGRQRHVESVDHLFKM